MPAKMIIGPALETTMSRLNTQPGRKLSIKFLGDHANGWQVIPTRQLEMFKACEI